MESIMEREINKLEIIKEHYQNLKEELGSTHDVRDKNVIFERLINLTGVMQSLISISKDA